jgi:hypothetical protein
MLKNSSFAFLYWQQEGQAVILKTRFYREGAGF